MMPRPSALAPSNAFKEEAIAFDRFRKEFDLERLRAPLRRELRTHGGQRRIAADMRIPRGSLRKFVEMKSVPTGRNRDALDNWVTDRPEATVTAGMVSLAVLAIDLPADFRLRARRRLAGELASVYREAGALLPAWLHEELSDCADS